MASAVHGIERGASSAAYSNGHAAGDGGNAKLLERAGVAPKFDSLGSLVAFSHQAQSAQFASFQADAPPCDICGNITVRSGNCYLCHNCGNSMGCS
jgi:ribonucleoside-diphosphate reductase alpha chain